MKKNKGVLTVEAALMVPLFVFAILFMTQFMKVVYVYDTVQTNIHNTAKFVNSFSYLQERSKDVEQAIVEEVQSIFSSITGVSSSSEVNNFITSIINGTKDVAISTMCKSVLDDEISSSKRKWLGIKTDFNFSGSTFSESKTIVQVAYTVNISSPFINIDKDIPLVNKVIIGE